MLSLHVIVHQVLGEYHIRTTVWEDDPMLDSGQVMSRADIRACPSWLTSEDELSIVLAVTTEWLNELVHTQPNGRVV